MPYDEGLAERIRAIVEDDPRVREKRMFGGLAFLVDGSMSVGIIRDELMVRVGPDAFAEALARPHARPMDFTGRPMRGFVQVEPAGFEEDAELADWVARGVAYASTRPTKGSTANQNAKPNEKRNEKRSARRRRTPAKRKGSRSPAT